jgi:hypothetical protein
MKYNTKREIWRTSLIPTADDAILPYENFQNHYTDDWLMILKGIIALYSTNTVREQNIVF